MGEAFRPAVYASEDGCDTFGGRSFWSANRPRMSLGQEEGAGSMVGSVFETIRPPRSDVIPMKEWPPLDESKLPKSGWPTFADTSKPRRGIIFDVVPVRRKILVQGGFSEATSRKVLGPAANHRFEYS